MAKLKPMPEGQAQILGYLLSVGKDYTYPIQFRCQLIGKKAIFDRHMKSLQKKDLIRRNGEGAYLPNIIDLADEHRSIVEEWRAKYQAGTFQGVPR
jgi:hypothetical protein